MLGGAKPPVSAACPKIWAHTTSDSQAAEIKGTRFLGSLDQLWGSVVLNIISCCAPVASFVIAGSHSLCMCLAGLGTSSNACGNTVSMS